MLIVLCITFFACNKSDDSDDRETIIRNTDFTGTIDGGTFNNYQTVLETYVASSIDGTLTIAVTDTNTNVIRLFLNGSTNLNTGSENIIGDSDSQGFITALVFRDQANAVTYNAVSGNIIILDNVVDADETDINYATGKFEVVLNSETNTNPISFRGNFQNIRYSNL